MYQILDHLPSDARVLDLACNRGSFDAAKFAFTTIRTDLNAPVPVAVNFVQSDAARLPFQSRSFDAVICNHGLEHFVELKHVLQEVGRVLKRHGSLFVTVPDARSLQDRLYRKLTNGGGHVNLFDRPSELAAMLSWYSGLPQVATKLIHTSFLYLNRRNVHGVIPKQLSAVCWRWELPLAVLSYAARRADIHFGKRMSVYGWAMYFGDAPEEVDPRPWTNVCIRCGQAHPSGWLIQIGATRRTWFGLPAYSCPDCGASNFTLATKTCLTAGLQ